MRREIYVICRDYQIPFLILHFQCEIEIALQRIHERNSQIMINEQNQNNLVSDESFHRIQSNFQIPNPQYICDRSCLLLDGNHPFTDQQ